MFWIRTTIAVLKYTADQISKALHVKKGFRDPGLCRLLCWLLFLRSYLWYLEGLFQGEMPSCRSAGSCWAWDLKIALRWLQSERSSSVGTRICRLFPWALFRYSCDYSIVVFLIIVFFRAGSGRHEHSRFEKPRTTSIEQFKIMWCTSFPNEASHDEVVDSEIESWEDCSS